MSIRSEIEKKLITWASNQSTPIPVFVQNTPSESPKDSTAPYLQIFFLTSVVVNPDVSAARERETGIFQVNVCVPQGTGAKAGEDLAKSVKSLFPVLPKIGTVSIERPPQQSMGFNRTDGYYVIPISVSYRQEREASYTI